MAMLLAGLLEKLLFSSGFTDILRRMQLSVERYCNSVQLLKMARVFNFLVQRETKVVSSGQLATGGPDVIMTVLLPHVDRYVFYQ